MAVERERPYGQFNFRVVIENGPDAASTKAAFQEVSGLGMEITVSEYRAGNFKDNAPMKVTGTYKVPDITLKRGVIGDLTTLYEWINQVRGGSQTALRTVTIELQSEDHASTVQSWKLTNARPTKYTGPSLSGKGTDVAIEELVLASERIDLE
ncbi:MAG TPA: phage tail protein [Longimicrobium sp.]|jgi:phage tail-like protein|uniref:phage tail protein n=1 Tax=Longimicrobium sp. TaxID=2029185 RepID=UPI002EDA232D